MGPLIPQFWTSVDNSSGFQSGQPYLHLAVFPEIHLWCNICWPLGGQHGHWAILFHIPVSRHWWGWKPGSIILPLSRSVRPDRRSTDSATPARLRKCSLSLLLIWFFAEKSDFIGTQVHKCLNVQVMSHQYVYSLLQVIFTAQSSCEYWISCWKWVSNTVFSSCRRIE